MNAVAGATLKPYEFFTADIMISAEDANALNEGSNAARQWMLMALSDPQVTDGIGLLVANLPWERDTSSISLTTFGIDPGIEGSVRLLGKELQTADEAELRWVWLACRTAWIICPKNCRVDRNNVWLWRGLWLAIPASFWQMNPLRRLIKTCLLYTSPSPRD